MGKVIQFIQDSGEGRYTCFKTQKVSLDTSVSDVLTYDDKTSSHAKKSSFAESDDRRAHTVRIGDKLINRYRPIFSFFLDGSRHIYKIDDIAIGKKIYPFLGDTSKNLCEKNSMNG